MKKVRLFLPVVAFATAITAAVIGHAATQETTWVYADNGEQVENPDCEFSQAICATEYNLNPDGTLGAPTGNEMRGDKAE